LTIEKTKNIASHYFVAIHQTTAGSIPLGSLAKPGVTKLKGIINRIDEFEDSPDSPHNLAVDLKSVRTIFSNTTSWENEAAHLIPL
jgi:hypothetical protein